MGGSMKQIIKQHSLRIMQAWIKKDEKEASTINTIAIHCKRGSGSTEKMEHEEQLKDYSISGDEYIKFIAKFGPAMAGVSYWNYNKANIVVSELLTVTDEAFIHLCIINYAKTWKAQEKTKWGQYEKVPVSKIHYEMKEHV
jgi:hypothetical protein